MAQKYDIPSLCTLTATKYADALLACADPEEYFESVTSVYERTTAETGNALRVTLVQAACTELCKMLAVDGARNKLREVVLAVPEFGWDVLVGVEESEGAMDTLCDDCGPNYTPYVVEERCQNCGKQCVVVVA